MDGNVPLFNAIMGGHESVRQLLIENGADISYIDAGHLACSAVEKNDLEFLKELTQHNLDVTKSKKNGATALHLAVTEGNIEIVKFLVDKGANVDKPDANGWTPRNLADHQCNEEIKIIFQNIAENKKVATPSAVMPISNKGNVSCMSRFQSEPSMPAIQEGMPQPPNKELTWLETHRRRRANPFNNSIFGMMSAATSSSSKYIY